jgi:hypothetical protein
MTRPRFRALLLGTGAWLATAYASVADFAGVIHGYYNGTGVTGLLCAPCRGGKMPISRGPAAACQTQQRLAGLAGRNRSSRGEVAVPAPHTRTDRLSSRPESAGPGYLAVSFW